MGDLIVGFGMFLYQYAETKPVRARETLTANIDWILPGDNGSAGKRWMVTFNDGKITHHLVKFAMNRNIFTVHASIDDAEG